MAIMASQEGKLFREPKEKPPLDIIENKGSLGEKKNKKMRADLQNLDRAQKTKRKKSLWVKKKKKRGNDPGGKWSGTVDWGMGKKKASHRNKPVWGKKGLVKRSEQVKKTPARVTWGLEGQAPPGETQKILNTEPNARQSGLKAKNGRKRRNFPGEGQEEN